MAIQTIAWCAALFLTASDAGAGSAAPPAADHSALEATLYTNLRDVINRGVDLYQAGDISACYRLFEGSLRTVKPLLAHRPGLVTKIDTVLADVEKNPVIWQRAFAFRRVLDAVRKDIKPSGKKLVAKGGGEKPSTTNPSGKTKPPPLPRLEGLSLLKPPRPLEPETKKPEVKKPEVKKPETPMLKMPRVLKP